MSDYAKEQEKCGIKVGDKVRVLRKAEDHEEGWPNFWVERMDRCVGNTYEVLNIGDRGVGLDCCYAFPYFALEKVDSSKQAETDLTVSGLVTKKYRAEAEISTNVNEVLSKLVEDTGVEVGSFDLSVETIPDPSGSKKAIVTVSCEISMKV